MTTWQQRIFLSIVMLVGVGLLLVLVLSTGTQAQGPTLPTPTNEPTDGESDDGKEDRNRSAPLAHIELKVLSAPAGAWSVVQWQDSDGNWHDVEGWRGLLPENGVQRWAVEAKDFNTGPFRWVVMQGASGAAAGMSETFDLPAGANETVRVTVVLP